MTPTTHFPSVRVVAWLAAAMIVATGSQSTAAQELPKNFVMHDASRPLTAISFEDGQGRARSLADFKGKVVLLNIWATWCVSCRLEMPALDQLQAALGGADFEVVPLSIDRNGIDAVAKFYAGSGISHLAMYIDTSGKALRELDAVGLPTTLIIDRAGQEIGRIVGPAEWDASEIGELLKSIIAKQGNAVAIAQNAGAQEVQKDRDRSGFLMGGFRWLKALFTR